MKVDYEGKAKYILARIDKERDNTPCSAEICSIYNGKVNPDGRGENKERLILLQVIDGSLIGTYILGSGWTPHYVSINRVGFITGTLIEQEAEKWLKTSAQLGFKLRDPELPQDLFLI